MSTWGELNRRDLKSIDVFKEAGWRVIFAQADEWNNRTTPSNIPHNEVWFKKGDAQVSFPGFFTDRYLKYSDTFLGYRAIIFEGDISAEEFLTTIYGNTPELPPDIEPPTPITLHCFVHRGRRIRSLYGALEFKSDFEAGKYPMRRIPCRVQTEHKALAAHGFHKGKDVVVIVNHPDHMGQPSVLEVDGDIYGGNIFYNICGAFGCYTNILEKIEQHES